MRRMNYLKLVVPAEAYISGREIFILRYDNMASRYQ